MMDIAVTTMAFAACAVSAGAGVMLGGFLASGKRADQDSEIAALKAKVKGLVAQNAMLAAQRDAIEQQAMDHAQDAAAYFRALQKISALRTPKVAHVGRVAANIADEAIDGTADAAEAVAA